VDEFNDFSDFSEKWFAQTREKEDGDGESSIEVLGN